MVKGITLLTTKKSFGQGFTSEASKSLGITLPTTENILIKLLRAEGE